MTGRGGGHRNCRFVCRAIAYPPPALSWRGRHPQNDETPETSRNQGFACHGARDGIEPNAEPIMFAGNDGLCDCGCP